MATSPVAGRGCRRGCWQGVAAAWRRGTRLAAWQAACAASLDEGHARPRCGCRDATAGCRRSCGPDAMAADLQGDVVQPARPWPVLAMARARHGLAARGPSSGLGQLHRGSSLLSSSRCARAAPWGGSSMGRPRVTSPACPWSMPVPSVAAGANIRVNVCGRAIRCQGRTSATRLAQKDMVNWTKWDECFNLQHNHRRSRIGIGLIIYISGSTETYKPLI
jgi:hypothetical protein